MYCRKHNLKKVRQTATHYYCLECDRLALVEAKQYFATHDTNSKRRYILSCITCGVGIYSTRGDKKYCKDCLKKRHQYIKIGDR